MGATFKKLRCTSTFCFGVIARLLFVGQKKASISPGINPDKWTPLSLQTVVGLRCLRPAMSAGQDFSYRSTVASPLFMPSTPRYINHDRIRPGS
jgi:hypothetical protein